MRKIIVNILMLILPFGLLAQPEIKNVLLQIESNNTKLSAYRNLNEAQKLENKTGIFPENPEIEFNYLWGNPSVVGNRQDFSVLQSFDFPTSYGIKKKIANAKSEQSDLGFELQRKSILFQAKTICNQLIYLNALNTMLEKRLEHAKSIADAYKIKFEKGDINIIENNKARFNLLNVQKEVEANQTERAILLTELTGLNGGKAIVFNQSNFETVTLPLDFNT
ncbi:MAG: TolC family protein, partial [Bacteroidetes bacterium]|nr:TolC family protein [Bacteroidota bacterium]